MTIVRLPIPRATGDRRTRTYLLAECRQPCGDATWYRPSRALHDRSGGTLAGHGQWSRYELRVSPVWPHYFAGDAARAPAFRDGVIGIEPPSREW